MISKYKTFAHFIEGEYDEFMLPFQPAVVGKYFANNKEKNLALNEAYEKNVRPSFPEQWRGTGGDEEAEYISYELGIQRQEGNGCLQEASIYAGIKGKGIKINDTIVSDEKFIINQELFSENYLKLSIGKKRHIKVELS